MSIFPQVHGYINVTNSCWTDSTGSKRMVNPKLFLNSANDFYITVLNFFEFQLMADYEFFLVLGTLNNKRIEVLPLIVPVADTLLFRVPERYCNGSIEKMELWSRYIYPNFDENILGQFDVSYRQTIYGCEESSSSSSSSSSESSSSTELMTSSSSSSIEYYCTNPVVTSGDSSHLSNWTFNGMTNRNSNNGTLYLNLVVGLSISVYDTPDFNYMTPLVAGGGSTGIPPTNPQTIILSEYNGSGLSGTVYLSGARFFNDGVIVLSCP